MDLVKDKITVKYQTRKDYCHCCEKKLDNPEISKIREFNFSLEDLKGWTNWSYHVEEQEELKDVAEEFIYETISFYAVNHDDKILLCEGEIERVVQYIVRNFAKKQ